MNKNFLIWRIAALNLVPARTWDTYKLRSMESELAVESCIQGHRVFQYYIWTPTTEERNRQRQHAVVVVQNRIAVRHVSWKISAACAVFLHWEGSTHCFASIQRHVIHHSTRTVEVQRPHPPICFAICDCTARVQSGHGGSNKRTLIN